jgi:hypothetical protein
MSQSIIVQPIVIGDPATRGIRFVAPGTSNPPSWMESLLTAAQIKGQFRDLPEVTTTLLATCSTADGTIIVVDQNTLLFSVADTSKFPTSGAYIDFHRLDGGVWSPLPVMLRWPVRETTTQVP